jgi:hypothetical protein
MDKIQDVILSVIKNPISTVWFPTLTEQLVSYGWKSLREEYGLQEEHYSTEAALHSHTGNLTTATVCLYPMCKNDTESLRSINIYPIPEEIASIYSDSGAKPYSSDSLKNSTVLECLQESLGVLAAISTVYGTISRLVVCLHILQPEGDDFDISYSLPDIPFSIFVSVPSKRMDNDVFRVAEAILHEAMHLQLTLIEQFVPMIIDTNEKYFSPWKNEHRHPRGVLHAIYVFCAIKQFFELLIKQDMSAPSAQYLRKRCNVISNQLAEVNDFMNCQYLTEAGQTLTNKLLLGG